MSTIRGKKNIFVPGEQFLLIHEQPMSTAKTKKKCCKKHKKGKRCKSCPGRK